jgi:hypothetical protein
VATGAILRSPTLALVAMELGTAFVAERPCAGRRAGDSRVAVAVVHYGPAKNESRRGTRRRAARVRKRRVFLQVAPDSLRPDRSRGRRKWQY